MDVSPPGAPAMSFLHAVLSAGHQVLKERMRWEWDSPPDVWQGLNPMLSACSQNPVQPKRASGLLKIPWGNLEIIVAREPTPTPTSLCLCLCVSL